MQKIIYPIVCLCSFIRIIDNSNDIAVFFFCVEDKTSFIEFVDINTLLTLNFKTIFGWIYFQKCIFIF